MEKNGLFAWPTSARGPVCGPAPRQFCSAFLLAFGTTTNHKAVESVFGDLPPQIFIAPECSHRVEHLLVVGVGGGRFGVHFVRGLKAGFHGRLREWPKLRAVGN